MAISCESSCGVSEGGLAALVTDLELARTCDMVGAAGVRIAVDFVTGKGCGGWYGDRLVEEPSFRDLT